MEVEELLKKAWKAVKDAKIPKELQPVALKGAIDFLRGDDQAPTGGGARQKQANSDGAGAPDESAFFEALARESGMNEEELRDVLELANDGAVHVIPPTKDLGTSVSEQAKTVIAIVAGARSKGLNEKPVDGTAVRAEADRKGCYQSNNFSASHLGPLKGFNSGSQQNQIVVGSRWVEEFKDAVAKARGEATDAG